MNLYSYNNTTQNEVERIKKYKNNINTIIYEIIIRTIKLFKIIIDIIISE